MTQVRHRLTADARRQAVLDTACRVFSRSSYRGATTAEIARAAGVSEPILYRHFGSKRDLYLACLDESWRALRVASVLALAGAVVATAAIRKVEHHHAAERPIAEAA